MELSLFFVFFDFHSVIRRDRKGYKLSGYIYYCYMTHLRVFHTSVSWRFLSGVRVTASLLKSLGVFSVFWLIFEMLSSRWSPLVLSFLKLQVPSTTLWGLFQVHQLLLISPSSSCSIVVFFFWSSCKVYIFISFFSFLVICFCGLTGRQNSLFRRFFFFSLTITKSGR